MMARMACMFTVVLLSVRKAIVCGVVTGSEFTNSSVTFYDLRSLCFEAGLVNKRNEYQIML